MSSDQAPRVSAKDRAAFERQAAALATEENDDEGTPEWRAEVRRNIDDRRAALGNEPLADWWETKTEQELHEHARALGLLRPVR